MNLAEGSYFGGRTPEDGRFSWEWPALRIYNLVRAVTHPYPGAFTMSGRAQALRVVGGPADRTARCGPRHGAQGCAGGGRRRHRRRCPAALQVPARRRAGGGRATSSSGRTGSPPARAWTKRGRTHEDPDPRRQRLHRQRAHAPHPRHHRLGGLRHGPLAPASSSTPWTTRASTSSRATSRSTRSGSSTTSRSATWCCRWSPSPRPATYVKEPLRVFELDFEENLRVIRQCVQYGKRVVFPSTSEVYGMCHGPGVRRGHEPPRARTDQQAALDLLVLQAAPGPRHRGLRPAGGAPVHALPALQLDRAQARRHRRRQGGLLAGGHAVHHQPVPGRADPAGGRRASRGAASPTSRTASTP